MPGQPLPQGFALHRGSAGDLHRLDASGLTPPLEPALDGGTGDPEEFDDLFSANATIHRREHPQSQVLRISVHGEHSCSGPLLMQSAVRGAETQSNETRLLQTSVSRLEEAH